MIRALTRREFRKIHCRCLLTSRYESIDEPHTLAIDLDGTLIDSSGDVCRALNSLLRSELQYSGPVLSKSVVKPMIGDGMEALVKRAIEKAKIPAEEQQFGALVEELAKIYNNQDFSQTCCLPMVKETIMHLKENGGHNMVVCTNKDTRPTVDILQHFGLHSYFSAVVGGDSLPVQKPHPGHLIAAVEIGGGDINRTLMIGDGHNDVLVAQTA